MQLQMQFKNLKLQRTKEITRSGHVNEILNKDKVPHDEMLGIDFLVELEVVLDLTNKTAKMG